MKWFKRPLIILVISFAIIGLFVGVAYASNADQIVQGTTDRTIFRAGRTVTITGTVNGDVFCAAQTVNINATVNGDVICAAQTMNVNGTVNGSVRLAGQSLTLGAKVERNASLAGQDIIVEHTAQVGQDMSLAAQTISVNGNVTRDLTGAGNNMDMRGAVVGRDMLAYANKLVLADNTEVKGNVTYTSPSTVQRDGTTKIGGNLTYHKSAERQHRSGNGLVVFKLFWMVAMTALAVVLVALFPALFRRWNTGWGANFGWAVLVGFVAMFVLPVMIFALMATVVGIPLGLLLLLLWLIVMLLSMPVAAYIGGSQLVPQLHPVWVVLIGSVVLGLIELIPVVGWIVGMIAYWLGSGALLMGFYRHYRHPVYIKEVAKE